MAEQAFARVEKKYLLNEQQFSALTAALSERGFAKQLFGSSTIQSIYYDTDDYQLIRRSLERPAYKEKLRLRCYGAPNGNSMAYAEIKKKYGGVVYKRRTGLPLNQALSAIGMGALPEECGQIGREINWFLKRYSVSPKAMIIYERDAWLNTATDEARITFDRNIRFRSDCFDMTLPTRGAPLIGDHQILMEIKIEQAWPMWLNRLIRSLDIRPAHFSKYGTAYREYLSKGKGASYYYYHGEGKKSA